MLYGYMLTSIAALLQKQITGRKDNELLMFISENGARIFGTIILSRLHATSSRFYMLDRNFHPRSHAIDEFTLRSNNQI